MSTLLMTILKHFRPRSTEAQMHVQAKRFLKLFLGLIMAGYSTAFAMSQGLASNTLSNLISPGLWRPEQVPFYFKYGGRDSSQLLTAWRITDQVVPGTGGQTHRYSYTDPATRLRVTAEVRLYPDHPGAVDWVLTFRNNGHADTPILKDILPLSWTIPSSVGDCSLRHARGSNASATDFEPLEEHFGPGGSGHLESSGGDSSSGATLPFFNLRTGDHGLVGAIGWTGNWKVDFAYASDGKSIALKAGMKRTHLLLHPGEQIRTPRIVLMSWTGGGWQDAQNAWRRLLLAHYTPLDQGQPIHGPVLVGKWGSQPIQDKLDFIAWLHDHQIPIDVYAVDAGWFGASVGAETDPTNPWWQNRGDWFPSPRYYPRGLKPLGDALKADSIGFSLWIEPETSMPGRQIIREHPGWFLHTDRPVAPGVSLANLGDPEARKGITALVSRLISEYGMTWYRQDFNIPPDRYWELKDTPDRIGMTEIGHITGLYAMLDDLLAQHPGLRIDNCASGGRRLDIEMMARSFVVWRTDYGYIDTQAEQAQTQALAPWVPETMGFESYSRSEPWTRPGPYSTPVSLYFMRLAYAAGYGLLPGAAGLDNPAWVTWVKQALAEYREVQPYFYGDFYPLTPYSLRDDVWTAWQWDRPEKQDGVVLILRRPRSRSSEMELALHHLNLGATYTVEIRTTYDKAVSREIQGSELAHLQLRLADGPSSALVFYRQK